MKRSSTIDLVTTNPDPQQKKKKEKSSSNALVQLLWHLGGDEKAGFSCPTATEAAQLVRASFPVFFSALFVVQMQAL